MTAPKIETGSRRSDTSCVLQRYSPIGLLRCRLGPVYYCFPSTEGLARLGLHRHLLMKKVFVALSGGVDSAVSAALLKDAGYDVTGAFIKIWSPEFLECTWQEDRLEAKRVAAHLGIPFREIDLSQEYRDSVVSDMLDNYKKGFTPNPDVLCNRRIKFGAFTDWAFVNGADTVATGHYARIAKRDERYALLKGVDATKDQSYFLYRLTEKDLSRALFPVGSYTKKEIREKALAFRLPNAMRPDSQGLCFVGDVPMHEFLGRFLQIVRGALVNESGAQVGEHDGAALYTIGQRHGFRLARSAPSGPYFVTHIDTAKNTVTVAKERRQTECTHVKLSDVHWIRESAAEIEALPRYHGQPVKARITGGLDGYSAELESPAACTPGQSLVFYDGETCLGGAVIQSLVK